MENSTRNFSAMNLGVTENLGENLDKAEVKPSISHLVSEKKQNTKED